MIRTLNLFIDGASKGNPGRSGVGFIFIEDSTKKIVLRGSEYIGIATNNQAEYLALIIALKKLNKEKNLGVFKLKIFSDSELVVNQINGVSKIRSGNLIDYYLDATALLQFLNYKMVHISGEENNIADALANKSLEW